MKKDKRNWPQILNLNRKLIQIENWNSLDFFIIFQFWNYLIWEIKRMMLKARWCYYFRLLYSLLMKIKPGRLITYFNRLRLNSRDLNEYCVSLSLSEIMTLNQNVYDHFSFRIFSRFWLSIKDMFFFQQEIRIRITFFVIHFQ